MSAEDKLAVAECVYRYATGVDTRNWAMYRSLFVDEVEIDFSSFGPGLDPMTIAADDWVAGVKPLFEGLAATQHMMSNPLVELEGDSAEITMYVRAHHVLDPDDPESYYTVGGYYRNRLVRDGGAWKLVRVNLNVTWRLGNPEIMEAARAAGISARGTGRST
jgi:3-phenylpropionate/cinnamic acid dioxygenase small subunit